MRVNWSIVLGRGSIHGRSSVRLLCDAVDCVFTDFAGFSDGSNRSSFSGQGKVVAQHLQDLFAAVVTYRGLPP